MYKRLSTFVVVTMLVFTGLGAVHAASFSDVDESYRFYEEIETLNAQAVIQGYTDGTFPPIKL